MATVLVSLTISFVRAQETLQEQKLEVESLMQPSISTAPSPREEVNAELPPNYPPVVLESPRAKIPIRPGYSAIPLPAFIYDPNEGAWVGGLVPFFRTNDRGEVEDIYAPLYLYNRLIGGTYTMNYFGYRHETTSYHAIISHAARIEHDYDFGYQNLAASDGRYIVAMQMQSNKSAFNRFYDFGNETTVSQQTNYTLTDNTFKLSGGVNISKGLTLLATERYRSIGVQDGAVKTLTQTVDAFPDVPGIDGADIVGQSLTLSYDTRDNAETPLQGTYATLMSEYNENIKFTERNNWWRLTGQARHYAPHANGRATFVFHAMADGVVGQSENNSLEDTLEQVVGYDDQGNPILQSFTSQRLVRRGVPFYERPTLGGEDTLRGFGDGRFVDNFAWVVNLEERVDVFNRSFMGTVVELELAPFVDIGRVGRQFTMNGIINNAQINPGIGVRMLARPNIAGRMDIGWSKDGMAIFVGLDYPF